METKQNKIYSLIHISKYVYTYFITRNQLYHLKTVVNSPLCLFFAKIKIIKKIQDITIGHRKYYISKSPVQ